MKADEVRIRRAERSDVFAVARLWREMVLLHSELDSLFTPAADALEQFADFARRQMDDPETLLIVAERAGVVIGYCLAAKAWYLPVFRRGCYGIVHDIAVTAAERRRGVGGRLFRDAQRWFSKHGIRRIELRVMPTNKISTSFWRKHGFWLFLETLHREI